MADKKKRTHALCPRSSRQLHIVNMVKTGGDRQGLDQTQHIALYSCQQIRAVTPGAPNSRIWQHFAVSAAALGARW